ncbi:MAG TPA: cell division protein SepF [Firmicutes bacterium]|nr:cell division protein SepF [Bacillota bacterium]
MAGGWVGKFLNLMGFEEILAEEEPQEPVPEVQPSAIRSERKKSKVVGLPSTTGASKVVVLQPESFETAKVVADHLKARRTVIANLGGVDDATAQRLVDFVSGAVFALGGTVERVGSDIVLFAPSNVDVLAHESEEKEAALPWLR